MAVKIIIKRITSPRETIPKIECLAGGRAAELSMNESFYRLITLVSAKRHSPKNRDTAMPCP
jgi:hypothetical protein